MSRLRDWAWDFRLWIDRWLWTGWALLVCFVLLVAVVVFAAVWRPAADPVAAPAAPSSTTVEPAPLAATPAPSSTPTLHPEQALKDVAAAYVHAYQFGYTSGGSAWRAQLAPVASPAIVNAVVQIPPEVICSTSYGCPPIKAYVVEHVNPDSSGTVVVILNDGSGKRLTVERGLGGLLVVGDENAKT